MLEYRVRMVILLIGVAFFTIVVCYSMRSNDKLVIIDVIGGWTLKDLQTKVNDSDLSKVLSL